MKTTQQQTTLSLGRGEAMVEITAFKGVKRSWDFFKKCMKEGSYPIPDLRKSSKNKIPLLLECNCGERLEIRRVKDFPLEDKMCKCGIYFIKWI